MSAEQTVETGLTPLQKSLGSKSSIDLGTEKPAEKKPAPEKKKRAKLPYIIVMQTIAKVAAAVSAIMCIVEYVMRYLTFKDIYGTAIKFYCFQVYGVGAVSMLFSVFLFVSAVTPGNSKFKVWQSKHVGVFTSPFVTAWLMLYMATCQADPGLYKSDAYQGSTKTMLVVETACYSVNLACIVLMLVFAFSSHNQQDSARDYYASKHKTIVEPYRIRL